MSSVPADPVKQTPTLEPLPPDHPAIPNVEDIVLSDGMPVESVCAQAIGRMLCEILYGSWQPGAPFLAVSNVGLFYRTGTPAIVPDVMVKMDSPPRGDFFKTNYNNGFFTWDRGVPEIAIEVVLKTDGGETTDKVRIYETAGVPNYVVWDPAGFQSDREIRYWGSSSSGLVETEIPEVLPRVGLGLRAWEGVYDGDSGRWLRWFDAQGEMLLTKGEVAEEQSQLAAEQKRRAEAAEAELARLRERLG